MIKRLPLVPTLIVLAAVAVMIRLGFWQIDRMQEKAVLLAQYEQAAALSADIAVPADKAAREKVWFRHTAFACSASGKTSPSAGHDQSGQTGWAHWATCRDAAGNPIAEVNIGVSTAPQPIEFTGMEVRGTIAPDGPSGARVVADQPYAELRAAARPDPREVANNHWSYAIQWFLFAGVALAIYGIALRKRLAARPPAG